MTPHVDQPVVRAMPVRRDGRLRGLLRGYRFRVCRTPDDVRRALDVRRRVYRDECGYDVSIPDAYDARSWILLAEDTHTGEAVGSIRVTPRVAGPIEAEEHFVLPPSLTSGRIVEATRFAVLPSHRTGRRFLPAVALGLFRLTIRFVLELGVDNVILCAKPERVWSYEWIGFDRTGYSAPYGTLDGAMHELMVCRVGSAIEHSRDHHRFFEFLVTADDPEVVVPSAVWPDVARTG